MFNFQNRQASQPQSQGGSPSSPTYPSVFNNNSRVNGPSSFKPPGRNNATPKTDEAIDRQVAQWDNEMDNLDKAQEQLLNDQWRLLRTQIGSLMSALSEVRAEVSDLKENTLTKEVEGVVQNLLGAHQEHGERHAGLLERVDYLEKFIGESADHHTKVESLLAESSDKHGFHKATMETRLEYLEKMISENAEAHRKELAAETARFAEHEKRVAFLESCIGESADKHDDHKASMESRLEFIEGLIGDNADKHWKEIQAAHGKLSNIHDAIKGAAKASDHGELEQRLSWLEDFMGESCSKVAKEMAEAKSLGKTLTQHQTVETRLEFIENLIGDSADKHGKEIDSHKGKMFELQEAIAKCAKHDHASGIESRVDYLEKFLGESLDKHDDHKVNMEGRLEYIEALIGDNADKHAKELEATKAKVGSQAEAMKQFAKAENHGSLEKKVAYLESFIGDSYEKHKNEVAEHLKKHAPLEAHQTLETRMEYLEGLLGDSADKHAKQIDEAHGKLKDLHLAIQSCAKMDHHHDVNARVEYLEKAIGDSADKHDKHVRELEAAHSRIRDLHGKLSGEGASRDQKHSGVEDRVTALERKYGDHADNLHRKMSTLEAGHLKLKNGHDDLHGFMRGDAGQKDGKLGQVEERLAGVETVIQQNLERLIREHDDTKQRLRDTQARLEQHQGSNQHSKATLEQRLESLEHQILECGAAKFSDFSKDFEKRLTYMQEDQKRARDVLESSLQEQIRLEHSLHDDQARQLKEYWEREMKTRMAYQDQYKDMITQERFGREAMENAIETRVRNLESALGNETGRLWTAIDKHTHEGLQQPQKEIIIERQVTQPPLVETVPHIVETIVHQPHNATQAEFTNAMHHVHTGPHSPRQSLQAVAQVPTLYPGTSRFPMHQNSRTSLGPMGQTPGAHSPGRMH